MRKILFKVGFALLAFLSFAGFAEAGVTIQGGISASSQVWTKANSPYTIDGQIQFLDKTLTIEPGVTVMGARTDSGIVMERGKLEILGTGEQPVTISGMGQMFLSSSTVDIKNTSFALKDYGIALHLAFSNANIASSTFDRASIYSRLSDINIYNSSILNNPFNGLYIVNDNRFRKNIVIRNSILKGHGLYAIRNLSYSTTVDAINNWWGSSQGPGINGNNAVSSMVTYSPWLLEEPILGPTVAKCCSNVLFIPGIMGTRLHDSNNTLWEPNRNADVEKLYLNTDGKSLNSEIVSSEPIDTVFGLKSIYGKFMGFMDDMVKRGDIGEWRSFGYDWRKPIVEVVEGSEQKVDGEKRLLDELYSLASSSPTGKVSIVAHSNGGLVTKYLIKKLSELNRENIIDSIISVGVPYLGTPEALVGLLHGGNQSILNGLVVRESVARGLGANMSSAYSLLPSVEFFTKAFAPSIAFASSTIIGVNDGSYTDTNSEEAQKSFVLDSLEKRNAPLFGNTRLPIEGNSFLLGMANSLHRIIDTMAWPAMIPRFALIGLNSDTTKTLVYRIAKSCKFIFIGGISCNEYPTYEESKTIKGDGTVLSISAASDSGTIYGIDLKKVGENENIDLKHANILEASSTQKVVSDILTKKNSTELPDGIFMNVADIAEPVRLRVSTHSPVELHAYDDKGNHTGLIDSGLIENDSAIAVKYEENIPGSDFDIKESEHGYDTYISLPADLPVKISVLGTDFGFATLKVSMDQGGNILSNHEYAQFPVTPLSVAKLDVSSGDPLTDLPVDFNGDNVVDISVKSDPDALPSEDSALFAMKNMIEALFEGNESQKQIEKIDKIIEAVRKGKVKQIDQKQVIAKRKLEHLKLDGMSPLKRSELIDYINILIDDSASQIE